MDNSTRAEIKSSEAKREKVASQKQKKDLSQSISSPVEQILFLQRTIGNEAVGRLIKSGTLQAKLRIGKPDDIYEKEADQAAEQVMRIPESYVLGEIKTTEKTAGNPIQRSYQEYKPKKEDERELIQAKGVFNSIPDVSSELESSINTVQGGGQPLPESVRAFFEQCFGYDFSKVRVHTDSKAIQMNRIVGAKAFTHGSNIYFGADYSPTNLQITAHELAHVVQQTGGMPLQTKMRKDIQILLYPDRAVEPRSAGINSFSKAQTSVQRLSWRDLNPLEAAKKLAEKMIGVIRSLGSTAWDTAKNLGSTAWNTVKDTGANVWDTIKGRGASIWNTVTMIGSGAWDTVKAIGSSTWGSIKNLGTGIWNTAQGLGTKAWNTAKQWGGKAWDSAKHLGQKAWDGATRVGTTLWDKAKNLGSGVWNSVKNTAGKAWGKVKGMGSKAWNSVKGLAGKAYDTAKNLGGKAVDIAKDIANKATVENLCKAIRWLAGKAYDLVAPWVKKAWNKTKEWGGKAWNAAKEWGGKLWNGAKGLGGKIADFAKNAASRAYNTIKNGATKAWNFAKDLGGKAINGAKEAASKAWDLAKRLGTSAWDFAKTKASDLYNKAKQLGSKVWDKATSLGKMVWTKAQALGSEIADAAKALGSKVLGIADKLTGGAASKVANMAKDILGKAAGLLSWVVSTAQDLANKAINTAKEWISKALSAAKEAAARAFNAAKEAAARAYAKAKEWGAKAISTAKDWAGKAWNTAKEWGTKAISTAKDWAGKAWNTAKDLGSKAWNTAKDWAGKAWNTAKEWGGKAWDKIKEWGGKAWDFAKEWGGKAWDFAKSVGGKLLDVAKALWLDRAWNLAKELGSKAFKYVKDAGAWVAKRLKPVIDAVKPVAEILGKAALLLNPVTGPPLAATWLACKTMGCTVPKLVNKGSRAQTATDVSTDIIPVVSTAKDGCGCLTGDNIVTGEKVGTGERVVRCITAAIDIAAIVGAFFTEGETAVAEQAAKGGIRAWLERLFKIGGKELAEEGEKELAKQMAKMGEKELAEALSKMGEKELKELAEQAGKAGEKELKEKIDKELAERLEKTAVKEGMEKNVLAEEPVGGGHEVRVKPDGIFELCSEPPCANIGLVYREVLNQNPNFAKQFAEIKSKGKLAEKLIASDDPALVIQGEKLAKEAAREAGRLQKKLAETGIEGGAGVRFRPEPDLLGSGRHGLEWDETDAFERAFRSGKPQGKFESFEDIQFAVDKAAQLGPGKSNIFPLPPGSRSIVFMPDGINKVPATQVFVKVRANGSVHAFPLP